MTSTEMFVEFRVELDKVDSQAYPEIYPEQAFIFINDAVMEYAIAGRRSFEQTTYIADDLRTLVKYEEVLPSSQETTKVSFQLPVDYMYHVASYGVVTVGDKEGSAPLVESKHNSLNKILVDPFNKPNVRHIPFVVQGNSLVGFKDASFDITKLRLTFMKLPVKVSKTENCDLPEHLHKAIIKRAVQIALENLESRRVNTNN